nr:epoxide hydrolase family protein [Hydrocarboniphaga sp.]
MKPFKVAVGEEQIADLRRRLSYTRWPDQLEDDDWSYGTDGVYLRQLCDYWRDGYDWRAFESRLNAHPQFTTEVDDLHLHFYHLRSHEPGAKPLLLSHGWPGSIVEFQQVIGPLADPRAHGGDPADAFHVIAPSLPGFGFSGPTTRRGVNGRVVASAFNQLMLKLGYPRYFAQGGDWGSMITVILGGLHAEQVEAIHLNLLTAPPPDPEHPHAGLSNAEIEAVQRNRVFAEHETGYQQIQRTKPQTLAYGLSDSPAGLAGWIVEKFRGWSDCGGDIGRSFSRDQLLDNISIYWLTGTINSSMRLYFEEIGPGRRQPLPKVAVPTGHALFPAEITRTPRPWADAKFNIRRWQTMPRGGHFAAMEEPGLFVGEVREFFREFR